MATPLRKPGLRNAPILWLALSVVVLSMQPAFGSDAKTASDCARLASLGLPRAVVLSAEFHEAGQFKDAGDKRLPNQTAFCRVVGSATPSSDSDIRFEVWLPAAAWNGRLWGVGNGDFAGSISQPALNSRMADGYAAVGTDAGHRTDNAAETRWAIGHPQQVVDFGHRGIHLAAVNAGRLIAAFYGRGPAHAYFGACSNGGRQALMEAQRYPEDYDGIIAGAPAQAWTSLYIGAGDWQFRQLADPARLVPAAKLPAVRAAVAAACHMAEGVVDDPKRCTFDVGVLACRGAETDRCLTPPQLQTVRGLYEGNVAARGRPLLRGYALGSEAALADVHYRSGPGTDDFFAEVLGFWRDLVFEDPAWDYRSYDMERDGALATNKLAAVLDADDADLSRYAAHGGKLIVYQGWVDPLVPPAGTIDYVERVERALGRERSRATVRLFMAPGVGHCGGGDAPNQFGQFANGSGDPETSLGAALQRWVEQGVAPEKIVARKLENDDDPAGKVVRSRPLCAWPRVARYVGRGSVDAAASFECSAPD